MPRWHRRCGCRSLTPPATPWRTHTVAAGRLHEGRWQPTILAEDPEAVELTDCGPPLPGVSVRTAGSVEVGPLELSAPSLADGYLTRAGAVPVRTGDWFRTTDVGRATPSSVVVAGRSDDVFVLAGRKIFAQDLEKAASAHPAVRAGCCAAIVVGGELQVIAEPRRRADRVRRVATDCGATAGRDAVTGADAGGEPQRVHTGTVDALREDHRRRAAFRAEGRLGCLPAGSARPDDDENRPASRASRQGGAVPPARTGVPLSRRQVRDFLHAVFG